MRRVSLSAAFAGLLLLAVLMGGFADPGGVKQIVPGVWFREGDLKQYGHCNNIIIEMKDYLIVIDANFPSGARLALADAKKVSSKPVKYVFDTHHHGDHAYGNPVWTKMGAITLAYVGVAEEMKRYEPKSWLSAAKGRKDVAELNLPTAEPPKETFTKSPHVLTDGDRRVEFHFFGWAHTRGDGFAWLPKEKVLCTGDAVVNGAFNFTGQANIQNWPNVIAAVQKKFDPRHVLPGHGAPGGKEVLAGQKLFFEELRKAVKAARDQGKKLDQLVTMTAERTGTSTIQLPDSVNNWVGGPLAAQVRDTYEELEQGKPHGEIVGGK
jgi:glyoxylase-like metal-dependent hydrolase (beta-lactamase superfamily II)